MWLFAVCAALFRLQFAAQFPLSQLPQVRRQRRVGQVHILRQFVRDDP